MPPDRGRSCCASQKPQAADTLRPRRRASAALHHAPFDAADTLGRGVSRRKSYMQRIGGSCMERVNMDSIENSTEGYTFPSRSYPIVRQSKTSVKRAGCGIVNSAGGRKTPACGAHGGEGAREKGQSAVVGAGMSRYTPRVSTVKVRMPSFRVKVVAYQVSRVVRELSSAPT